MDTNRENARRCALTLPQEVFDTVMSFLSFRDCLVAGMVCREWRKASIRSAVVNKSVMLTNSKRDTDLYDFLLWLEKGCKHVKQLRYVHYDSEYNNVAASEIFKVLSESLTSLKLTYRKNTRNRRGIPGPVRFDWIPRFPLLQELDLTICWHPKNDIGCLKSWAPSLKKLVVEGSPMLMHPVRVIQIVSILPDSLEYIKLVGNLILEDSIEIEPRDDTDRAGESFRHKVLNIRSFVLGFDLDASISLGDEIILDDRRPIWSHCFFINKAWISALRSLSFSVYEESQLLVLEKLPLLEELKILFTIESEQNKDTIEDPSNVFTMLKNLKKLWIVGTYKSWPLGLKIDEHSELTELLLGETTSNIQPEEYHNILYEKYPRTLHRLALSENILNTLIECENFIDVILSNENLRNILALRPLDDVYEIPSCLTRCSMCWNGSRNFQVLSFSNFVKLQSNIHNSLINTPGIEYFGSKDEALGNHQPSCVEDAWSLALST